MIMNSYNPGIKPPQFRGKIAVCSGNHMAENDHIINEDDASSDDEASWYIITIIPASLVKIPTGSLLERHFITLKSPTLMGNLPNTTLCTK